MKIVLCSGGYDPLHSGHIEYFKSARALGDMLIVGINSDSWLERKKGRRSFMPIGERITIVENLKMVDSCILFNDDDGTACEAIRNVQMLYPNDTILFANGGDRNADNIPEMIFKDVIFKFGVGGETKINSSRWILEEWKTPKTIRSWGYYRVLHDVEGTKVKELTIFPNKRMSLQRHTHRSEYWHIIEGKCLVLNDSRELRKHDNFRVPAGEWHCLNNPYAEPCKVLEIQYGSECIESDIERSRND